MISLARLTAIMRKEALQLRRDRLTFAMIAGIPLLQVLLFGYAINTDVRDLRAALADQAGTQLAREIAADAEAAQVLDVRRRVRTAEELERLLRRGEISAGLYIPPDFDARVQRRDRAAAQLLVDGSDPILLATARGLGGIDLAFDSAARVRERAPIVEVRSYYNPERRSAVFVVPGLIGVILTMTMILFTAMAIVRERERGNLELLIMTPVHNVELMIGKILPYVLIGLVQITLILFFGVWLFDVPIAGSIRDIYLAASVFVAANLTLGLVISTLAQTQFQAMQMTLFFYLPSILLSGFMFPFEGMPRAAQLFAELLPLTHFVRLVRGVMVRGAELGELMADVHALAAFMVITLTIAVLRFHKRLD